MIPIDEFRTSYTHHELGCTLQRVEMEKCQRNPEDIKKYGPLTEEQMKKMAKVRGLLALVRTTNGKKRIEFVNRDFNAAINVRCAVLEKRPRRSTRVNFIGQPLKVELYEKKLEAVVRAGRERLGGVCTSVADVVFRAGFSPLLYCRPQRLDCAARSVCNWSACEPLHASRDTWGSC
jgi:hypothetical protein